jgi:hypothetical protein
MTRLEARMREEREAEPSGWLARQIARMRAGFAYGAVGHLRPVGAMALTVMLLIGGGTYLGVTDWNHPEPAPPAQTAVVHDLQLLDSNQQILDQLESMSGNQKDGD